jgi:hypothetical protein
MIASSRSLMTLDPQLPKGQKSWRETSNRPGRKKLNSKLSSPVSRFKIKKLSTAEHSITITQLSTAHHNQVNLREK